MTSLLWRGLGEYDSKFGHARLIKQYPCAGGITGEAGLTWGEKGWVLRLIRHLKRSRQPCMYMGSRYGGETRAVI